MTDDLSAQIAARRKKAADLRRQADLLEAEARGMELAGRMTSPPPPLSDTASTLTTQPSTGTFFPAATFPSTFGIRRRAGRQKGAISKTWRAILGELHRSYPTGFGETEVCEVARNHGLENLRPKDARDRMKAYAEFGYTEIAGNGFRVSGTAIGKFKLADALG